MVTIANNGDGRHDPTAPEDDRNPAGGAPDTIQITVGRQITFAELLERLGHRPDEIISLCSDRDGVFRCVRRPYVKWAPQVVAPPEDAVPGYTLANCWFSINTIDDGLTRGRGKEEDTARLATLVPDLDFGEDKCGSDRVALDVADDLAAVVGQPVAITFSGHGLHPYWPIADGAIDDNFTHEDAKALVTRFGALVVEIAGRHGAKVKVDGVFDLARVMRVPGTLNIKPGMEPVEAICYEGTGKALTVAEVEAKLDEGDIPEHRVKTTKQPGRCSHRSHRRGVADAGQGLAESPVPVGAAGGPHRCPVLRPGDGSRHGNVRDDVLACSRLASEGSPGVGGDHPGPLGVHLSDRPRPSGRGGCRRAGVRQFPRPRPHQAAARRRRARDERLRQRGRRRIRGAGVQRKGADPGQGEGPQA